MRNTNQQNKVVFVIDIYVNRKTQSDVSSIENYVKQVTLSAFRLLSYFVGISKESTNSKKRKRKKQNLQWGFKFFSSKSLNLKCEQHRFKDFKNRVFDEFERELNKRVSECNGANQKTENASKKYPCQFIGCALKELLADFQWETPDIFSPVKRSQKKTENDHNGNEKFVFLFSTCPTTAQSLRQFSGKVVLDGDIFIDALMGQTLLNSFQQYKLRLFWIDDFLNYRVNCFITGVEINISNLLAHRTSVI